MVLSLIKTEYKTVPTTLQHRSQHCVLKPACLKAFIIVRAHSPLYFDRIFRNYFIYLFCLYHAYLQFTNECRTQ